MQSLDSTDNASFMKNPRLLEQERAFNLTNPSAWHIICLTKQPTSSCALPVPVKIIDYGNSRLFFTRGQGGYFLLTYLSIATIKLAVARMTINVSYVLISMSPFRKNSERAMSRHCRLFG